MDQEVSQTSLLLPFLDSAESRVRKKALATILGLSASEDGRIELVATNAPQQLCGLIRREEHAEDALSTLINLCGEHDHIATDTMIAEGVLTDITEILFSPKSTEAQRLSLMLLANITVYEAGAAQVLSAGDEDVAELLVQKLQFLLLKDTSACTSVSSEDSFHYVAYVIANLTQLKRGREILLARTADKLVPMQNLPYQLTSPSVIRRRGVAASIRNCFFEQDCWEWLLNDIKIVSFISHSLMGSAKTLDDEDKEGMDPYVYSAGDDKVPDTDPMVRRLLVESLLIISSTRDGCTHLRTQQVYPVLRELHLEEEDADVEAAILKLVDAIINDQDDAGFSENMLSMEPSKLSVANASEQ